MTINLSPLEARRLAVLAQQLAGPRPEATHDGVLDILQQINCLQIDPIRAVERTQLLVLWSRLGPFDPALLDELQADRLIFEAWAHCASLVLTEDYPLFSHWMRKPTNGGGVWGERVREWMAANDDLRRHVLDRLRSHGPLSTSDFDDIAAVPWESTGWNAGRNVTRMLDFLYGRGEVMSVGRNGNTKYWHLVDAWLPEWVDHDPWIESDVVRTSAGKSLKALGVATPAQIKNHFIRNQYPQLEQRLRELEETGVIVAAQIVDGDSPWPGPWYIHSAHLPALDAIRGGDWSPRTVFLSPFDNLICHRPRTEQLFDFNYRIEIYVPKDKRQYGYYVLPILHGDRFIGRMDSQLDRKTGVYHIHMIYPEREQDVNAETAAGIAGSLRELITFIGAESVVVGAEVPGVWREKIEQTIRDL